MAALRTTDWVEKNCGLESPVTLTGRIQSLMAEESASIYNSAFIGFSASKEALTNEEVWNADRGVHKDPFETPPKEWSVLPQATLVLSRTRSWDIHSMAAKSAKHRQQ